MDDGLLYDLCARARRVHQRTGGSEPALRGLVDFISAAADPDGTSSDAAIVALIDAGPEPVGFRWGLERLEAVSTIRTVPPSDYSADEVAEYEDAQADLLRRIGRDSGDPAPGPVQVVKNVLEQFVRRWY
ncbi:hypothetical protein ACIQUC_06895 [Curtobacterium sp. NPDC098951]|uniref:hypothetical protein n=1 Tax=Curtobacterium sp. NPDC098951 TaxID=3363974 RepID=UPI003829941D